MSPAVQMDVWEAYTCDNLTFLKWEAAAQCCPGLLGSCPDAAGEEPAMVGANGEGWLPLKKQVL